MAVDRDQTSKYQDQTLRVCFISHQYPPGVIGGIGRFTADLAAGFAAAGHEVHVLTSQGGVCGVTVEDGVWVHRLASLPAVPEALRTERAGLFLSRIGVIYREVERLHNEKPFDIVSSPIWLAEGLLVALDRRFVSILSLHTSSMTGLEFAGSNPAAAKDPLIALELCCVGAHSHTHANSHAAVRKITAEYAAPNGVVVIPHGVNDQSSAYLRTRHDDGRVRVLIVGLLDKRKGADVLYDIIPKLLSRFSTVEFGLVGPAFPMAELNHETLPAAMKRRFSSRPDILQRVHFAGVVGDDELYRAYANADLLLLPSRYESFGLSVIEAMSFGLPVIAWKAGGVCETVIDGETGILVDVEDRDGLMEATGRLATDADLRRRYGASGRKRYLSHFSTTISISRTIAAYRKIAETTEASVDAGRLLQRDTFVARFAEVIEGTTALRGESALATARLLVDGDGSYQPIELAPPRVAVIVRCFNSAENVVAALDSVQAQSYRNFHCVIVDDASSDESLARIEKWIAERHDKRFLLVRHEIEQGEMACAAVALAACDGEFVAFLNSDDLWFPDFLELHVRVIHGTSIALSRSDRLQVDSDTRTLSGSAGTDDSHGRSPKVTLVPPACLNRQSGIASSAMYRRSLLDAVVPHDLNGVRTCAQEYMFELCQYISGSFVIHRQLSASRRDEEHGDSAAGARPEGDRDMIIVRALLDHLLDNPPRLRPLLPARRRDILIRTLFRKCLLAGVPYNDPRVHRVLGSSRVLRDRLRAKVWFLRRSLA